jgi:hypothetical protein
MRFCSKISFPFFALQASQINLLEVCNYGFYAAKNALRLQRFCKCQKQAD